VLQYLESYVEHFKLGSLVTFGHAVEKIEPAPGGGYVVSALRLSTGVAFLRFKAPPMGVRKDSLFWRGTGGVQDQK
jgi:hypothetical protein